MKSQRKPCEQILESRGPITRLSRPRAQRSAGAQRGRHLGRARRGRRLRQADARQRSAAAQAPAQAASRQNTARPTAACWKLVSERWRAPQAPAVWCPRCSSAARAVSSSSARSRCREAPQGFRPLSGSHSTASQWLCACHARRSHHPHPSPAAAAQQRARALRWANAASRTRRGAAPLAALGSRCMHASAPPWAQQRTCTPSAACGARLLWPKRLVTRGRTGAFAQPLPAPAPCRTRARRGAASSLDEQVVQRRA